MHVLMMAALIISLRNSSPMKAMLPSLRRLVFTILASMPSSCASGESSIFWRSACSWGVMLFSNSFWHRPSKSRLKLVPLVAADCASLYVLKGLPWSPMKQLGSACSADEVQ